MNDNNANINDVGISALQLLQDINSGITDPRTIDVQSRQQCIEILVAEGYKYPQIAQILKCSEKTVSRDMKDIRARNEISPNLEFAKQFIGDMFGKAINHHSYLMRLSRDVQATIAEKISAELAACKILIDLTEKLQSLGYLPLKPKEVVGDIYHHREGGDAKTYMELKEEIKNIERIAREAGTLDEKTEEGIKSLEKRIEKAEILEEVIDLKKNKTGEDKKPEEDSKNEER